VTLLAGKRGVDACVGDAVRLPWRTSVFDAAVCVAVLHHIATRARRLAVLSEIARVLQPGAQCLVYCWALEQVRALAGVGVLLSCACDLMPVTLHSRVPSLVANSQTRTS
jgi:SAM-dependent methyltransferase